MLVRMPREFSTSTARWITRSPRTRSCASGSTATRTCSRTRASASTTSWSARSTPRTANHQFRHAGSRPAGPPVLHEHAALRRHGTIRSRGPWSRRRPSASTTRSRAAGQQLSGGRRSRNAQPGLRSRLRARHPSVRMGIAPTPAGIARTTPPTTSAPTRSGAWRNSRRAAPWSYTRRIGDPNIDYFNLQGALYVQDDIRVRTGLTLSPGLRYEMQTHVSDFNNLGPRFGVTWSPFRAAARQSGPAPASSTTG